MSRHLQKIALKTALEESLPLHLAPQTYMCEDEHVVIADKDGNELMAVWVGHDEREEVKRTAEAVITACNTQEKLVGTLERIIRCHKKVIESDCGFDCVKDAESLIAQIRGKP